MKLCLKQDFRYWPTFGAELLLFRGLELRLIPSSLISHSVRYRIDGLLSHLERSPTVLYRHPSAGCFHFPGNSVSYPFMFSELKRYSVLSLYTCALFFSVPLSLVIWFVRRELCTETSVAGEKQVRLFLLISFLK